jgi:hypothetical protein
VAAFSGLLGSAGSLDGARSPAPPPTARGNGGSLRLTLHWRADVDGDPVAVRGALVLRSVGVLAGSPLAAMEPISLRQIGAAASPAAVKFPDIVSALPVLEPLFRCMAETPAPNAGAAAGGGMTGWAQGSSTPGAHADAAPSPSGSDGGSSALGLPGRRLSVVGMMAARRAAGGMLSKLRTGRKQASALDTLRPTPGGKASPRPGASNAAGVDPLSDGDGSDGDGGPARGAAPKGLTERVFVGVCAHCTTLSEQALRTAFRQLDANGDAELLW